MQIIYAYIFIYLYINTDIPPINAGTRSITDLRNIRYLCRICLHDETVYMR